MAFSSRRNDAATQELARAAAGGDKSSWFADRPNFGTLVYPDDMNADNFYPDCVKFTIQKRLGVSIADVTDALGAGVAASKAAWEGVPQNLKKELDKITKKDIPDETKREEAKAAAVKAYREDENNPPLPANMFDVIGAGLSKFGSKMKKRQLEIQKSSAEILGSIYLNMPNGIQFNEAANWSGQELGFMGKMTQDLFSGGGATGDTLKTLTGAAAGSAGNLVGAAVGAIPSLVSKLGISGGMFGAAIGAMAAGGPMQKGMESALGVAQNPYMEMMFSGIGFRKFSFEFILRPKSAKEYRTVAEIIRMLRTYTKPTFTEGKLGKSFMDYPMEFDIDFLTTPDGPAKAVAFNSNPNIPKLKLCVCDNVSTNYTPQSIWAAHQGGVPLAITLGLSFQETELVMAEDVHDKKY